MFALVHGTTAVEFPPADPATTIPLIDAWFTTTSEANQHLRKFVTAPVFHLGNLFRGQRYWGGQTAIPDQNTNSILFCGTLTANKTAPLSATIAAMPRLADWQLTIVGDGPEREELRRLARKVGVQDRVAFAGNQTDVRPYIVESSVVIAAGRAAIEAATAPRRVVVASSEGVHGCLNPATIEVAEAANFTGRSQLSYPISAEAMLAACRAAQNMSGPDLQRVRERLWAVGSLAPLLEVISSSST